MKEQMIKKLVALHQIKAKYNKILETPDPALKRKELQWTYRLLNILFSDAFSERFSQLGKVAACTELDLGKAAYNQLLWEGVQEAFEGQDEAYDKLHSADDKVLSELHYINFKKIVPHNWKKLRAMWKHLNSEYKAALRCFTLSGMNLPNFFEFCNGHHEIYYLQKHLESKPDSFTTVVADLPVCESVTVQILKA